MTLESLLSELQSLDWYIYSLGHEGYHWRTDDLWHCTLRHEAGLDSLIVRANANSLLGSINAAINAIPEAKPHKKPASFIEPKFDLSTIFANLRPKVIVDRRF